VGILMIREHPGLDSYQAKVKDQARLESP